MDPATSDYYAATGEDSSSADGQKFRHRPNQVKLNRRILLSGISFAAVKKGDRKNIDNHFRSIPSLHLQEKNIEILDAALLAPFRTLTTLYLHGNKIQKIQGLEYAQCLQVLYLNNNKISRIENLRGCRQLRKLYLGYNEIEVVEGLDSLEYLTDLHIENQKLPKNQALMFCPTSMDTIACSLQYLNISGNQLTHIEDLASMEHLEALLMKDNNITDLDNTTIILRTLPRLRALDLSGNPVAKNPKYKEKLIGNLYALEAIDGKEISDNTRTFIQRMCSVKASRFKKLVESYHQQHAAAQSAESSVTLEQNEKNNAYAQHSSSTFSAPPTTAVESSSADDPPQDDYLQSVLLAPPPKPSGSKHTNFHGQKHPHITSSLAAPSKFISSSETTSPVHSSTLFPSPNATSSLPTLRKHNNKTSKAPAYGRGKNRRFPHTPKASLSASNPIWTLGLDHCSEVEPHLVPQMMKRPQHNTMSSDAELLQPSVISQTSLTKPKMMESVKSISSLNSAGQSRKGSHTFGVQGLFETVATELPPWPHITKRKDNGPPTIFYLP